MRHTPRILVLLVLISLLTPTPHARAALGDHLWSDGWNAGGIASPDGSGHIATAGTFFGPVDFGGGVFSPVNFFGGDVFLARFDNAGNHVWSQQITPGGFGFQVHSVCAAPDGSIYLAGVLQNGDIDFGGGTLSGSGVSAVAAFEPNGAHRWSFLVGAGTVKQIVASNTMVAYTGYTSGDVDFGGGVLSSAGETDAFLAALTPAGGHLHSQIFGGLGGQGGMGLAMDSSNGLVMAASAETGVDFGGGLLTCSGMDLCLAAFNSAGVHQWSWNRAGVFQSGGGILFELGVDISSTGEVALGGLFQGSIDLGGGALNSSGSGDIFLARYNSSGVHLSSTSFGGDKTDKIQGVSFDSNDNLAIAGSFLSDTIDFGDGDLTLQAAFGSDWFAAIFDDSGVLQLSRSFTGNGQYTMIPRYTSGEDLLLHGSGGGNTDFGGGTVANMNFFMAELEGVGGTATSTPPSQGTITLAQNSPNPFNPRTVIQFRVEEDTQARLEVYDAAGRHVRTLLQGPVNAGDHSITFDGRDAMGRTLASGVYHYRLQSAETELKKSMILLK